MIEKLVSIFCIVSFRMKYDIDVRMIFVVYK